MDHKGDLKKTLFYGEAPPRLPTIARATPTSHATAATPLTLPTAVPRQPAQHRIAAGIGARLFSMVALAGAITGLAYVGQAGYHGLYDSFVAPIILSPDNDLVIQSKLTLARITAERQTLIARMGQNRAARDSASLAPPPESLSPETQRPVAVGPSRRGEKPFPFAAGTIGICQCV